MPKRDSYVPKHRDVPTPSPVPALLKSAPTKMLRSTLLFSTVAAAATGVAVSSGVLTSSASVSVASADLQSETTSTLNTGADTKGSVTDPLSADELAERAAGSTSRSDRRDDADPVKQASLAQDEGPAITRTEELSSGDPRDIARALLPQFGFSSDQFGCLDSLWTRESNWTVNADNPTSSAYGIPQALPGSKMSSEGADWATNPETQIRWGLGYIQDRYGSPCGAWSHSQGSGWY